MINFKNIILSFSCSVVVSVSSWAQDVHVSQQNVGMLWLNPSLAGFDEKAEVSAAHRAQYSNVGGAYSTTWVSGHLQVKSNARSGFGVGVVAFNDQAGSGSFRTTQAMLALSGFSKISRWQRFGAGILFGYRQQTLFSSEFSWDKQYNGRRYDPSLPTGEGGLLGSRSGFESGVGLSYSNEIQRNLILSAGASLLHTAPIQSSFIEGSNWTLYPRIAVHAQAVYSPRNKMVSYQPQIWYMQQGPQWQLTAGCWFRFRQGFDSKYTAANVSSALLWSLHYRVRDAIIPGVGYEYKRAWRAQLTYDVTLSKLSPGNSSRGGWEVSLAYRVR